MRSGRVFGAADTHSQVYICVRTCLLQGTRRKHARHCAAFFPAWRVCSHTCLLTREGPLPARTDVSELPFCWVSPRGERLTLSYCCESPPLPFPNSLCHPAPVPTHTNPLKSCYCRSLSAGASGEWQRGMAAWQGSVAWQRRRGSVA